MGPDSAPPSEEDDLLGRTVGKYTLTRLLGVGGMGRVYEGTHASLGKRFALKFIDRASVAPEALARFQREAEAASAVDSPHIVEIFDVGGSEDGHPYIVMELLRGEDLGHRIRRLGRLDLPDALRITAHVLRGLARAHDAGIVHRDLKPDNVFLVERDDDPCFAKLLDFGVSKIQRAGGTTKTITREGVVLGTPVYMSPEQAQAHPDVDGRTDLWAVGAILYECLAGRPPHAGPTYESVIVTICTKDAEDIRLHNPEVPEGLAKVLSKALARERAQRFQSAREMLDALVKESDGQLPASLKSDSLKRAVVRPPDGAGAATLGAVSTVAVTPQISASATRSAAQSRVVVAVAAAALAVGGIAGGVWWGRGSSSPASAPNAPQVIVLQTNPSASAPTPPATALPSLTPTVALASASAAALPAPDTTDSGRVRTKQLSVRSAAGSATAPASALKPIDSGGKGGIGDGLKLKTQ